MVHRTRISWWGPSTSRQIVSGINRWRTTQPNSRSMSLWGWATLNSASPSSLRTSLVSLSLRNRLNTSRPSEIRTIQSSSRCQIRTLRLVTTFCICWVHMRGISQCAWPPTAPSFSSTGTSPTRPWRASGLRCSVTLKPLPTFTISAPLRCWEWTARWRGC